MRIGRSSRSLRLADTAVLEVNMPPGRAVSERAKEGGLIIVFGQYAHIASWVHSIAPNQAASLIFSSLTPLSIGTISAVIMKVSDSFDFSYS